MNPVPRIVFIITLSLAISGCASTAAGVTKGILDKMFEPDPTSIAATMETSLGLNPDPNNRPSPLIVRIYELSSLGAFEQADFYSLYKDDKATLDRDLIASEEIMLKPGEQRDFEKELKPETLYVAVVAAYRRIGDARWRDSMKIELNERNEVLIRLDDLAVSLEQK